MKKLLLILVVASLSSCHNNKPSYIKGGKTDDSYHIVYLKDSRTGLCFAQKGSGNTQTMTCVPCTEEVEKLIHK